MREVFPDKTPGDQLAALHINDLNRVARKSSSSKGGSFQNSRDGQSSGLAPFVQRVVILIGEEEVSDDSSSESLESSASSNSSGSSESSSSGIELWEIRYRYYDRSLKEWVTDFDAETFVLDGTAVGAGESLAIGQVISAYWDPQRGAFIPIVGGGEDAVCDPQNAIMQFTVFGSPTGGTFDIFLTINTITETLTFDYDSTAEEFEAVLETHSQISETDSSSSSGKEIGDVIVLDGPLPDATISVEFVGNLKNQSILIPNSDWGSLTGGTGVGVITSLIQLGVS